jgi:hypothetical protein
MAVGRVERRPQVEGGQVSEELDRRLAFLARENGQAREEVSIGEFRRESDDVRVHHGSMYHAGF